MLPGRDLPLDLPAFVTDAIAFVAGAAPRNATALMMDPGHGLRSVVDAAEIARLEFANHMAATRAAPDGGGVPRGDDGFRGGGRRPDWAGCRWAAIRPLPRASGPHRG